MRFLLLILLLIFSPFCLATDEKKKDDKESKKEEPPKIGNFALPSSQQPGPLVGFGENIIDKKTTQLYLLLDDYIGIRKHAIDLVPGLVYGITDHLSIFINVPYAASYKENKNHSAGFEDAFVQMEYAFYNQSTACYVDQATVVGDILLPTGSPFKNPPTGAGSPSFFVGTTFNRTYVDWFVFTSYGATITTANAGTKLGNNYFYEGGFGRNIANVNQWIFAWVMEGDGFFAQRNRINGQINPNSGGNTVYVTPSLWASSRKLILQLGAGYAVTQQLYGKQKRNNYLLIGNLGWTF